MRSIILGIDPGLSKTGWGIVIKNGYDILKYVDCGIIKTNIKIDLYARLGEIYFCITQILREYRPTEVAIEQVFVNINPESSQKLIMARTAAILAVYNENIKIYQYSANQVKKNTTGKGHATKDMVRRMIERILKINLKKTNDASDALAIAISHANSNVH